MTVYNYAQLKQLALNAGFTGSSADTAAAIALAESGGNSNNVNTNYATDPGGSYGLMQINAHYNPSYFNDPNNNIYDPQYNMNVAYQLSNGGTNFSPWSTYKQGTYASYLQPGTAADPNLASAGDGGITITAPSDFNPSGAPTNSPTDPANLSNAGAGSSSGLPGGTGTPVSVGLQPSTVSDIGSWIQAPITAFEKWAGGQFLAAQNWFVRGLLIVLAIGIILVALWHVAGKPNPAAIIEAAA